MKKTIIIILKVLELACIPAAYFVLCFLGDIFNTIISLFNDGFCQPFFSFSFKSFVYGFLFIVIIIITIILIRGCSQTWLEYNNTLAHKIQMKIKKIIK